LPCYYSSRRVIRQCVFALQINNIMDKNTRVKRCQAYHPTSYGHSSSL
jgi:hypothetical protein